MYVKKKYARYPIVLFFRIEEAPRNLVDQDDNRGIGPFHEARVALSSNPSQQDERKRELGFGVRFRSR